MSDDNLAQRIDDALAPRWEAVKQTIDNMGNSLIEWLGSKLDALTERATEAVGNMSASIKENIPSFTRSNELQNPSPDTTPNSKREPTPEISQSIEQKLSIGTLEAVREAANGIGNNQSFNAQAADTISADYTPANNIVSFSRKSAALAL